jgi:hypothetical protein
MGASTIKNMLSPAHAETQQASFEDFQMIEDANIFFRKLNTEKIPYLTTKKRKRLRCTLAFVREKKRNEVNDF